MAGTAPLLFMMLEILERPAMWASSQMPVSPCVIRPRRSTAVASMNTMPAPPCANLPRWTRCQSVTWPSTAEYWHIGETTMRFLVLTPRKAISSNSMALAGLAEIGLAIERQRSLALELARVDGFAEEVQLDRHVVRVLEEDLEELRVGEAADLHVHLVLPDAVAHGFRVP